MNKWVCQSIAAVAIVMSGGLATVSAESQHAATDTSFPDFWKRFKSAVIASDKKEVADLTSFPFSIYQSHIRDRKEFLRRYPEVFSGEANGAQCFGKAEPEKDTVRTYSVYCPFKATPNDRENRPIRFIFELTKTGWKFAGLDNVNE